MDVTMLYYTTISPFDYDCLRENYVGDNVVIISPFYEGTFDKLIIEALRGRSVKINEIAVPLEVIRNYGTKKDKDELLGLTAESIKERLKKIVK